MGVNEAHAHYGGALSKQFIYNLAKSGKIKAFRAGKKICLNMDSLNHFLETSTLTDEQPAPVSGILYARVRVRAYARYDYTNVLFLSRFLS
jgi:excisionase family DNA binding protein